VALVRPHLEFCNVAWSPKLEKNNKLIEGVLRRANQVVPGLKDVAYEQRLERMNITSMACRRTHGKLIETHKYTHSYYQNENLFTLDVEGITRGSSVLNKETKV
jgi:hypothetical protein